MTFVDWALELPLGCRIDCGICQHRITQMWHVLFHAHTNPPRELFSDQEFDSQDEALQHLRATIVEHGLDDDAVTIH